MKITVAMTNLGEVFAYQHLSNGTVKTLYFLGYMQKDGKVSRMITGNEAITKQVVLAQ